MSLLNQVRNMKVAAPATTTLITSAFATILITWMLMKFLNWAWFKPRKLENWLREQGFSGNSYRFLHGDTEEASMMIKQAYTLTVNQPHDYMHKVLPIETHILNKYGKKSFMWNGPTPSINITDPKLIKEVFHKHEIFQKPDNIPLLSLFIQGMVVYEGEKWFRVRKIANPAFHLFKLKDMFPKMYKSCNDMITKWKAMVSNQNSHEFDVWPHIQAMTSDVISRTAFGSSYEDGRKIFELLRIQGNLYMEVYQTLYIPGWRFLPTKRNRRMRSNFWEMRNLIKGIINKREEALKHGEASNDDLLGALVESNNIEIRNKEKGMSVDEVIEECKLFYLAGQETTAALLLWTLVLLCMYPNWQQLAREEALQVIKKDQPKFDDLNHLKVINKILHEVLRLYSPVPTFTRKNTAETKLGDMNLPEGVMIQLPVFALHRDEKYWGDDAKEFNPDRFSEGVSKAAKTDEVPFFPFGWGPRNCLGQNFALMEAKLALAMILQNFKFELSSNYVHAPTRGVTVQPQFGAHLILHEI